MQPLPFGAIMAGGRNLRYGELKAFALVGDRPIIRRVEDALRLVTPDLILIANDMAAYAELGLAMRGDRIAGLGALGGLHSALSWAEEQNRPGILAVACDMPFVSVPLLRVLLQRAQGAAQPDAVIPESDSRRGVEPLCAYYSTRCLPAIELAVLRDDVRMIGFHGEINVERVSLADVQALGDPALMFLNVNTREERERAEQHARELQA